MNLKGRIDKLEMVIPPTLEAIRQGCYRTPAAYAKAIKRLTDAELQQLGQELEEQVGPDECQRVDAEIARIYGSQA